MTDYNYQIKRNRNWFQSVWIGLLGIWGAPWFILETVGPTLVNLLISVAVMILAILMCLAAIVTRLFLGLTGFLSRL